MAQGSHATLGGWEPKVCALCGDRALVSKQSLWFHWDHRAGHGMTLHIACAQADPSRARELIRGAA